MALIRSLGIIYFLLQADPRFLWNNYMLEGLIENKVELAPISVSPNSCFMQVQQSCDQ